MPDKDPLHGLDGGGTDIFMNGLSGISNDSQSSENSSEAEFAHIAKATHAISGSDEQSDSSSSASSTSEDSLQGLDSSEKSSQSSESSSSSESSNTQSDDVQESQSSSSSVSESSENSASESSSSSDSESESSSSDSNSLPPKYQMNTKQIKNDEPTIDYGESYSDTTTDDQASNTSESNSDTEQPDMSGKTPFDRKEIQESEKADSESTNNSGSSSDDANSSSSASATSSNESDDTDKSESTNDNGEDSTNADDSDNVSVNPVTQKNLKAHALSEDAMVDFKSSDNQLDNMEHYHGAFINLLKIAHKKYGKMSDKEFSKLVSYSNKTFKNCQDAIIADRQHIDYRLRQIEKDLSTTKAKATNGSKVIQQWKEEGLFSTVSKDMALLDRVVHDPRFQHFLKHLSNGELHQPTVLREEGEKAGAQVNQAKGAQDGQSGN